MRRSTGIALLAGLSLALPAPTLAASTATLRIVGYVPVMCDIDLLDSIVVGDHLLVSVHRSCNTGHVVTLSAGKAALSTGLSISELATGRVATNDTGVFVQPERYVDTIDRYEIRSTVDSSAAELQQLANTVSIKVEIE